MTCVLSAGSAVSTIGGKVNLMSSCVGLWRLNDVAASTVVLDASGQGNNGVLNDDNDTPGDATAEHSATSGNPPYLVSALTFDGTDDHVTTADFQSTLRGSFSISLWAKATTWGDQIRDLVGYCWRSAGNDYEAYIRMPDGIFQRRIKFDCESFADGIDNSIITDTAVLVDGAWNHIVCVANATTGFQGIYHNGILVKNNMSFSGGMPGFLTGGSTMCIGASRVPEGPQYFFAGTIDVVMFFSRAITAPEVEFLFNGGTKPYTTHAGYGTERRTNIYNPISGLVKNWSLK